jgi:hypothetical protein
MQSDKQQFSPGSKNWILKYFQLVEKNIFSIDCLSDQYQKEDTFHSLASKTGLIYGIPTRFIYFDAIATDSYTNDEKLKLLLFEFLLHSYQQNTQDPFDKSLFFKSLSSFYNQKDDGKWINKLFKTTELESIENTLSNRIWIETSIFESNYWFNYLSNCFLFVDVLLYQEFLTNKVVSIQSNYSNYMSFVLKGVIYMVYADNIIDEKEKRLLTHFLNSTQIKKDAKQKIEFLINEGIKISAFHVEKIQNRFLSKLIFELGRFICIGSHELSITEKKIHIEFAIFLGLTADETQESKLLCDLFLLENNDKVASLFSDKNSSWALSSVTNRWTKILGRNKEKLITELKESKELIALIQKSTTKELTKEEKEKVKNQFLDTLKTIPSIGIFLLPGGALLLPLILKIVPDLLPSAFVENQVDKKRNKL